MKKISVLLVEDEPTLAGIIKDALEEENFTVNIAYDGVSGLDLFVQLKPDIIVSDVMMPKLSGFEMVQKILEKPRDFDPFGQAGLSPLATI